MIPVALVDRAGVTTPAELARVASALTIQAAQFAAPPPFGWGIPATVRATESPTPDEWEISLLAKPDQPGALGDHDVTPTGKPLARVFPLLVPSTPWSSIASHELLEMLADAECSTIEQSPDGRMWAREVCDPVEGDLYTIDVDGVPVSVSNWITPRWFTGGAAGFDFLNRLTASLAMTSGGYSQCLDPSKGWQMLTAGERSLYRRVLAAAGWGRGARRARR